MVQVNAPMTWKVRLITSESQKDPRADTRPPATTACPVELIAFVVPCKWEIYSVAAENRLTSTCTYTSENPRTHTGSTGAHTNTYEFAVRHVIPLVVLCVHTEKHTRMTVYCISDPRQKKVF